MIHAAAFGVAAAGAGNVTPALPVGWEVNWICLLVCESNSGEAVSAPAGWTEVSASPRNSTNSRLTVFWRRMLPGDTAPVVADPGNHVIAQIIGFRYFLYSGSPFRDVQGAVNDSASTAISFPSVTAQAGDLWIGIASDGTDTSTSPTFSPNSEGIGAPTDWDSASTNAGGGGGFVVNYGVVASTGSVSPTGTLSTSSTRGLVAIALIPEPSPQMGDLRIGSSRVRAALAGAANALRVASSRVRALINVPSEGLRISQAGVRPMLGGEAGKLRISGTLVRVLVKGRVASPKIRAWQFPLDQHRFYGIDLGLTERTVVYDMLSQQWMIWGSGETDWLRTRVIRNWIGGRGLAPSESSIIAGDDATGMLYWLSPDATVDGGPSEATAEMSFPFKREVTGQVVLPQGYASQPCFGVQLQGSIGSVSDDLTVNLSVSDDRGMGYWDAGDVTISPGQWSARAHWRSLGSMRAPGRLFKVVDRGALKRIDDLRMDDPR